MKFRKGFISNSSSSSFVVISKNPDTVMKDVPSEYLAEVLSWWGDRKDLHMILPNKEGNLHFGWEFKRYYNFIDKCNFAVAQFMALSDRNLIYKYKEMFDRVVAKHISHPKQFFKIIYDYNYFFWDSVIDEACYVDHQSAYYEYKENGHYLFLSEENLENFLFNEESFIQCGNDNEDPTEEWVEARAMEGSEYAFRWSDENYELN